jgi:capsular polysaccharide transport system permease protein
MSTHRARRPPKLSGVIATAQNVARVSSTKAVKILAPLTTKDAASRLPALIRQGLEGVAETISTAGSGAGGGMLGRSFLYAVVLPTFLFWLYACFWQSERYVAETRLTVRDQHEKKSGADAASMASKFTGGGGSDATSQDAFIVLNYVKSRTIVADLGGREYMEKKFARSGIDYFSRLGRNANAEDLWKYWLSHLTASVDTLSGILTVRADAFLAKDALDVAHDIVRLSEQLVNKITLRNRGDALSRAELEVTLSRQALAEAREKTLQFRNQNVIIDPASRATSIGEQMGKLTLERIDLVNALSTFSSSLDGDAPSQRLQRTRLAAIDQQLAELKKKLADTQASDTVSSQIAAYERLKLDEQFAEKLYSIAQTSYHRARQELEKQQLYLITVVEPTLPESATYPKVVVNTVLLFCGLLVIWTTITLIYASIEDHMV